MDRQTLDAMIAQEIDQAVATFLPNGSGTMTDTRLRTALKNIAARTETAARTYYLGNLRTVDDLAVAYNVSRRRAQAIAKAHHDQWGVGMKIGNTYVFSVDEIESMRPGESGRPKKSTRG